MFIIWTLVKAMDGGGVCFFFPQKTRLNLAAAAFTGVTPAHYKEIHQPFPPLVGQ